MWSLDDAMEDDSRDYYYSDGESVDSVSSQGHNPEDDTLEDNGDDDGWFICSVYLCQSYR